MSLEYSFTDIHATCIMTNLSGILNKEMHPCQSLYAKLERSLSVMIIYLDVFLARV